MTPKEANENLLKVIMIHLEQLQSGKFGKPTITDLSFCGKLHGLISEGLD